MDTLVFGTDGWRDIIGDKFTFHNVARAAQAYAEHLLELGESAVVVGYDTRFNAPLFARRVAEVLAANGLRTHLSEAYLPTPALSFAVKHYGAGGGVMLTASHNPAAYLGFKLKGAYGGTATETIYRDVSARLAKIDGDRIKRFDSKQHAVESFDVRRAYYDALADLVDVRALKALKGSIIHDAMGGAAAGWLSGFCVYAGLELNVREIRGEPHPAFYGTNPEPLPQYLEPTTEAMRAGESLLATATDGDGDRLGVVLPGGTFFNSHQIFALLLDLMSRKGKRGRVVKTFTVSRIIERLAAARGLPLTETPVGFKHIVDAMLAGDVLVGGEESGGIGVAGHIPERDGIANSLLVLEALAVTGKSASELFADLEREADWKHAYDRLDLHLRGDGLKAALQEALESPPETFAKREVTSAETRDGVKLNLSGDAWVLFRLSGTEPVLRLYCEASTAEDVAHILHEARTFVDELL